MLNIVIPSNTIVELTILQCGHIIIGNSCVVTSKGCAVCRNTEIKSQKILISTRSHREENHRERNNTENSSNQQSTQL